MRNFVRCSTLLIFIMGLTTTGFGESEVSPLESFQFSVKKESAGVVRVTILPMVPYPGRIYSLSLFHESEKVEFPITNNPTEKEKDGAIFIALEETAAGTLTSPFYKKGLRKKGAFENPFQKLPVTDLEGKPVGSRATGILFYMARKSGQGVILTRSGKGKIPWKTGEGFSFLIHFKTNVPKWKILLSVVRVEVFRPYLKNPILSPVFNVS